jgi:hypothetical protein
VLGRFLACYGFRSAAEEQSAVHGVELMLVVRCVTCSASVRCPVCTTLERFPG